MFPLPSFQMLNCITNLESLGSGRENTHLNCFVVTIRLNGSHLLSSNHFFTLPIMTQSRLSRKLLIDIWRNIGSINFVVGHICGICEAEQEKTYFPISATYVTYIQRLLKLFELFRTTASNSSLTIHINSALTRCHSAIFYITLNNTSLKILLNFFSIIT